MPRILSLAVSGCPRSPDAHLHSRGPMRLPAVLFWRRGGLRRLVVDPATLRMAQSLWRDRGGSATLELAVLMIPMVVLLGGVYEFAWVFHKQKLIEAGVRDAARYLARVCTNQNLPNCPSSTDPDPC